MVIPWSFSGVSPTAVLSKEAQVLPLALLFLILACPTHGYSAFCSYWKVLQSAGQSEASHQLDCLGNTSWITAAIPFHPLHRTEASRQPNPIQEKAPTNPSPLNCSCKILSLLCCLWCLCSLEGSQFWDFSWQKRNAVREALPGVSLS